MRVQEFETEKELLDAATQGIIFCFCVTRGRLPHANGYFVLCLHLMECIALLGMRLFA
jgi:hypothetical protein